MSYAKTIIARREIKNVFGWIKAFGGLRQFKLRGTEKVVAVFCLQVIAYNLIRLGNFLKPALAAAFPALCPGQGCAKGQLISSPIYERGAEIELS